MTANPAAACVPRRLVFFDTEAFLAPGALVTGEQVTLSVSLRPPGSSSHGDACLQVTVSVLASVMMPSPVSWPGKGGQVCLRGAELPGSCQPASHTSSALPPHPRL